MTRMPGRSNAARGAAVVAATAIALLALSAIANATTFATARPADMVLVSNPGAEVGPGAPGWSGTLGYTTTAYGSPGEYPSPGVAETIASGGSEGGGNGFFDPGTDPDATLSQVADLTRFGAQIAAGEFDSLWITGWLGGWEDSPDTVDLSATPLDAVGVPVGPALQLAGPTASERGNVTALLQRTGILALPPATRLVRVQLSAHGQPGLKNHGYADEIVLWLGHHIDPNAVARPAASGPVGTRRAPRPTVKFGEQAPVAVRSGRRVLVKPRARVHCPNQTPGCTARVVVRQRSTGAVIGTATVQVSPNASSVPTAYLRSRARDAIVAGASIRAVITVSIDEHYQGVRPTSKHREATLRLA